ncbi:MAG TPA: dihydrodipicolinate synthase family protein [Tepidisphaeraceae bacterium]|nr:dihydrodipicolinate synthase family protein [Tepidisphaeraceae bacterium]
MKTNWTGVFPAVTTQFKKDQSLDLDATAKHLEALIASGVTGLVMLGSLGENVALLPEEKRKVIELALRVSKGRVPVLSGVAECSTAACCAYARDMEKLGADGLMVLPAMVYKSDPRETVSHFRAVARSSGLPILVYNNPVAYGVDITPEMFAELANEKTLVALKESSGNVRRITDLFNAVGDRYTIFCGVDDLILESVMLGAKGWVAGLGLAFPEENQRLWELMMAKRWDEALTLYRWYTPLLHLDVHVKFVHYIKLAIQECGLGSEWVRAPRLPLEGAEREQVLAIIHEGIRKRPKAK